jgi:hypothetical protein
LSCEREVELGVAAGLAWVHIVDHYGATVAVCLLDRELARQDEPNAVRFRVGAADFIAWHKLDRGESLANFIEFEIVKLIELRA